MEIKGDRLVVRRQVNYKLSYSQTDRQTDSQRVSQ